MSTKRREYEYGRIVSVDVVPLGDNIAVDVSSGATSITVEDASDFDEDGGQLLLNGTVYAYATWTEDDATGVGTINGLTPTLATNANEGDTVAVYDPMYLIAAVDKIAQVETIGADGNIDTLEASIAEHLVDKLDEGVRGNNGEQVKIEIEGDEYVIVDVFGLSDPNTGPGGAKFMQDQITVTATGAQTLNLTYEPIINSEHAYWNGLYQPGSEWSRDGKIVTFPDAPSGAVTAGDVLAMEYAYRLGPDTSTTFSPVDVPGMLIWYSSDYPTYPGITHVDGWQDLSGNNFHATAVDYTGGGFPQWYPTGGPLGDGRVSFHTGYFNVPAAAFTGLTAAECWFIVKADAEKTLASFHQMTNTGLLQHYNDNLYHWQEQWGASQRRDLGIIGASAWHYINMWSAPDDWGVNLGSDLLYSSAGEGVGNNNVGFGVSGGLYQLGLGYVVAGPFPGSIAAFLMWDRKLTSTERAQVEAYLTANPSGGRP